MARPKNNGHSIAKTPYVCTRENPGAITAPSNQDDSLLQNPHNLQAKPVLLISTRPTSVPAFGIRAFRCMGATKTLSCSSAPTRCYAKANRGTPSSGSPVVLLLPLWLLLCPAWCPI